MQIVIEIPDGTKNAIDVGTINQVLTSKVWSAIKNGTPLPKGHGRLIDADKAIAKICGGSCGCRLEECGHDTPCFSVTRVNSAQTIVEADTKSKGV